MTLTAILRSEHRAIERVLNVLELLADDAEEATPPDPRHARDILAFLGEYADRIHHAKEDRHLFPLLEGRGLGRVLRGMADEHLQGHALLAELVAAVDALAEEDGPCRFAEAAHRYIRLFEHHLHREENLLFPVVDRLLAPEEQQALGAEFARIEEVERGRGGSGDLHAAAARLEARSPR